VTTSAFPRAVRGLLSAVLLLALTAQSPAPIRELLPWCTTIPLPRADTLTLTSDVDSQVIHTPRPAKCRPLEVRTSRTTLHLAVADTDPLREHGLMGVPFVPAGQGMLFAFDGGDQKRSFWMKNTITPLDMIFVNSDGIITSVAANVPATAPGTPDEQIAHREGLGRYVVELGAGEAERLGLAAGVRVIVPPVALR
jgi:uncharacterized protein